MTIEQAKSIVLVDYLYSLGIQPIKQQGINLWYNSPFREEKEPSFKVNASRNEWYDFGIGKGGNIIALAAELYSTNNVPDLLNHIAGQSSFVRPVSFSVPQQKESSGIEIVKIQSLANPALFDYLNERHIRKDIAQRHCHEVYYTANQKNYFAVGFKNDSGGYEVRNKYFKGCTSKDISIHPGDKSSCLVFEGFMDYLSYLTLKNIPSAQQSVILLNSVSNVGEALDLIKSYPQVYTFLDNDEAGRKATEQIKSACRSVDNQSPKYSQYKDMNDLLCGKKILVDCKHESKKSLSHDSMNAVNPSPKKKTGRRMKF
ncbi:MAG: toprim domain-containing protein [Bacteroides sp.]|nr:toprim domain-containing protein [Bacteroides sp.]